MAHPRHYYQFKYIHNILKERGHSVYIAATDRKLLIEILKESKEDFILLKHTASGSKIRKIIAYLRRFSHYAKMLRDNQINVLVSKASPSCFFAKLAVPSIKAVIFPDSEDIGLTNNFVRHFADIVFVTKVFPLNWESKRVVRVNGTCENCYLDPRYFQAEKLSYIDYGYPADSRFVFFRFVAWKAHHDVGHYGFSLEERKDVVQLFIEHGYIPLISFESDPDSDLQQYASRFPKSKVMSVMTLCEYLVGDSQSMAAEAALLGLKTFRYNSWVLNDMANFKFFNQKNRLLNFSTYSELKKSLVESLEDRLDFFKPATLYWEECGDVNMHICNTIEDRFMVK